MAKIDNESKITALLARATDPGATEEERRTSAALDAELIKKHGFKLQATATPAPAPIPPSVVKRSDPFEALTKLVRQRETAKSPAQRAAEKAARDKDLLARQVAILGYELGRRAGGKR